MDEMRSGTGGADRWKCSKCGYVYDPRYGDRDHGIQPGTPFEDLPETWTCPRCGAGKNKFVKLAPK
jgi:rubredoxin